jgi:YVTN family beta-propeller protein
VSGEDAVKIWTVANPTALPVVVPIFGSKPQALARSLDGQKVYVAIFESGNRTTIANAQDVVAHGGLPAPNPSGRPEVGLVLGSTNGHWVDELNRNYDATHPYTLPDHDVAILATNVANPTPTYIDGLGTLNFNLGVHPVSGKLWVTNTDAGNRVRFEPNLRGKFLRTRVAIVDPALPASPVLVDLNPHIDYNVTPGPLSEIDLSLSQPGGTAFRSTGGVAYMTALGSAKVAVLDDAGTVVDRIPVGDGPSGLALDEPRHRLYVMNRFANTLSVVDTDTRSVVATRSAGYDPSPAVIRNGRKFLYDGRLSSGHGDLACASCHAGGHRDGLAWDLGDPNGTFQPPPPGQVDPLLTGFHPMKGPMETQSLRGLDGHAPFHWRGDRAGFVDFNPAFVSLMGRAAPLSGSDMQAFQDFVFTIQYAPNPLQNLDRTYPNPPAAPSAERGRQTFINTALDGPFTCANCHALPPGTNGQIVDKNALQAPQDMKVPQLRGLYEKGFTPGPVTNKRGFGFSHDGAFPTLFDFLRLPLFSFGTNDAMRHDVEAFLLAFDTGMAPAVGAQRTVYDMNENAPAIINWIDIMITQDEASNVDLVVKGRWNGEARGWVYDGGGLFRSDRASEALVAKATLRTMATAGGELTWTGVPPGNGLRAGIDRDEDGYLDRTELDARSDPADPASTPLTVAIGPIGGGDAGGGARALASFPNPAPGGRTTVAFEVGARQKARLRRLRSERPAGHDAPRRRCRTRCGARALDRYRSARAARRFGQVLHPARDRRARADATAALAALSVEMSATDKIGATTIQRWLDPRRILSLASGDFGAIFKAYEEHVRRWELPSDGLSFAMMRDGLAALGLHIVTRPTDETVGITFNIQKPPLNLFLTGDAGASTLTGRAFHDDVQTAESSRMFVQSVRPDLPPLQSTMDVQGVDVLRMFEEYYARSEQFPSRFVPLGGDRYGLVQALPDGGREVVEGLGSEAVRGALRRAARPARRANRALPLRLQSRSHPGCAAPSCSRAATPSSSAASRASRRTARDAAPAGGSSAPPTRPPRRRE